MTGKIDCLPIQAYVPESEEAISIIFKAPFLLILYFLDFRISLLSFVHTICALITLLCCSYSKCINIIPIKLQRLHLLVELSDRTANFDRRCPLKNLGDSADF